MTVEAEAHGLAGRPFRLGDWLVEPSLNRLSRGDTTIQLELKVMDVLVCLAKRAGEVVTRQEIIDRVWATEFISDNTLTHAVTELRNALGDHAKDPNFIETIHRRGYRLIAPVEAVQPEATVTQFPAPTRLQRDDERSPYPGLAAFTEADAEFFFGREAEVAQMWRKLTSRRLLAVIGPSGVGKSSFLRAGVIPARPEGWGVLVCQPGESPFAALARALVPEFAGDQEAISNLVGLGKPEEMAVVMGRWRQQSDQALLIVDQFEELFTLNPKETQARFAEMLRRVVDEADVHVMLSMRDDFLARCHDHQTLEPIFDSLTPIKAPTGEELCLALVEPARRLDFNFEDDRLAAEMVAEVEGERGALPMLAFAVAQLWDQRDRNGRLLTREAYENVGGVGGALGQHAEATLRAIGEERLPIVREILRNLISAEGTRAARDAEELLSVFPKVQRDSADGVLRQLIDARLLTSYEEEDIEGKGRRRVEVVHEALLTSWPRLARWQTQDADSAQLRDHLRQAARTWDEHDQTKDYLWTGRAFREYSLWRETYPGGLSELEVAFATAMTSLATHRRNRRRLATAAVLVIAVVVATVFASLWRQSVLETRRAEAAKLLTIAQLRLEKSPTEALIFATASLELADTEQARRMALEALATGPPANLLLVGPPSDEGDYAHDVKFSPDGKWAELEGFEAIRVVSRDGMVNRSLEPLPRKEAFAISGAFALEGSHLFGWRWSGELRAWSVPDFQLLQSEPLPEGVGFPFVTRKGLFVVASPGEADEMVVSSFAPDGDQVLVGRIDGRGPCAIDPEGRWFAFARGNDVFVLSLQSWSDPPRRIGGHDAPVYDVNFAGDRVASELENGELWIRPVEGGGEQIGPFPIRERGCYFFDENSDWLGVYRSQTDFAVEVWDLRARKRSTAPRYRFPASVSVRGASGYFNGGGFVPGGHWLATAHVGAVAFWPLVRNVPRILAEDLPTGTGLGPRELAFTPDGRFLAAIVQVGGFGEGAEVWVWDLEGGGSKRTIARVSFIQFPQLAVDPFGRFVAVSTWDAIELVPLAGGPVRRLEGYSPGTWIGDVAVDPEGRRVAACAWFGSAENKVIRIWDLETGKVTVLGPIEGAGDGFTGGTLGIRFLADGSLVSSGHGGLSLWNPEDNSHEEVSPRHSGKMDVFDRSVARVVAADEDWTSSILQITDLETMTTKVLPSRIAKPTCIASDLTGSAVVSAAFENDGAVQIVPVSGGEPHLLLGHGRGVRDVAISPDERWIASAGQEGSVRLWPMPDLSKPPLHTLPHDELIAKLKTLTNLRIVRDEESSTGWKIKVGPFPGWATVPEW